MNTQKALDYRPVPEPAPVYTSLRSAALRLSAGEIGIAPSAEMPCAWGILMEMGFAEAAVTLLALADGTTSLYFGSGGGIIGGGGHAAVAQASRSLVAAANACCQRLPRCDEFPLPAVDRVRFYVLGFDGVRAAEAGAADLAGGRHPLAALFEGGQAVITQLRQV